MKRPKLIFLVTLGVIVLILIFQNTEVTTINLLFWTLAMPRSLLLSLTFMMGALAGVIAVHLLKKKKAQKSRVEKTESDQDELSRN